MSLVYATHNARTVPLVWKFQLQQFQHGAPVSWRLGQSSSALFLLAWRFGLIWEAEHFGRVSVPVVALLHDLAEFIVGVISGACLWAGSRSTHAKGKDIATAAQIVECRHQGHYLRPSGGLKQAR